MSKSFYVNTQVNIHNDLKGIIKSGNYEKVVLEIMKLSKKMFRSQYAHNEIQSNGECDFVDEVSGEKYDTKIPFYKKQGVLLGSNNHDYEAWIKSMIDEAAEFSDLMRKRKMSNAESLTLYKITANILARIKEDENLILFFPFPIVSCDVPGSILNQFAPNILSCVYNALEKNQLVNNRKIFAIYPCMGNQLAIRYLNKGTCEYVYDAPIKKYIDYSISLEV